MGKIILAPMEGVVDATMRDLLTDLGGIDQCVTEFIRVTNQKLPRREILRLAPELTQGSVTPSNVPVVVQFLGSDPERLAYHALKAAELGAVGIDLNFGCPSKTVNKHRGGAVLLDEPETLFEIVSQVSKALEGRVPLTAKMRLGNRDKSLALDSAKALEEGGAEGLVVHARTKLEGYRPPAHWEWIGRIADHVAIPVVANGEVWSFEDYQRCREVSGCEDVMIGRGLIARPDLALEIKARRQGEQAQLLPWCDVVALLARYLDRVAEQLPPQYVHGRLKQWLNMMRPHREEAAQLFDLLKRVSVLDEMREQLRQQARA